MGFFESIFGKKMQNIQPDGTFQMLNGYSPVFQNAPESVYEMALIRAAIHSFATFTSKLKPEIEGSAKHHLEKILQFKPNPYMDTAKYLYRLATIYEVNNTAFIVPIEDDSGALSGFYPVLPQRCEAVEVDGRPYLLYRFTNGKTAAIEFERVGILTKFQYSSELFGEDNAALRPTMQLITTQNQGIINSIKNGAALRFLAKLANTYKRQDIEELRKNFSQDNLSSENDSGLLIQDAKIAELKQLDSKPIFINAPQMAQINENVFNYYGTNANILQNKYSENEWNAFYEGKIEPFALQLSLVHSIMAYTHRELAHGNEIKFTANRLQFASNETKLRISTELFDRGLISRNGVMDIWNMAQVEGGDKFYIRGEYYEVDKLHQKGGADNANSDEPGISDNAATVTSDSGAETT